MTNENIDHTQTTDDTTSNKKKRRSWVGWAAFFAIIIAVTCWFQLVHQQKKSTNNYSQLQSSFHQTLSDTAQLSQTTGSLQNQIENQGSQIEALQAAFNRLQAANSGYETDIALQQVDRYLLQAHLSLTFGQDLSAATHLLEAADQRLGTLPEPQIIPFRQAITKDIVQLKSIAPIDTVGVLSKLSALRDQVASLPLFALNAKLQQFHTATADNNSTPSPVLQTAWKKTWDTTLATLKSLVIIRNRQNEISPLISVDQEEFLRQNLQLILQQAQWAVLQKQQSVYEYSLTQANEWIQRYFADNAEATQSMQAEINSLQELNLSPKTPDISLLIDALHALPMQLNQSRATGANPTPNTNNFAPIKSAPSALNNVSPQTRASAEKGELV